MKRVFLNYKILIVFLALCLATTGVWVVWRERVKEASDTTPIVAAVAADTLKQLSANRPELKQVNAR